MKTHNWNTGKESGKEWKTNNTVEGEVMVVRRHLLTCTRRSLPRRKCRRVRRHIVDYVDAGAESTVTVGSNSDTEYEDENSSMNSLI